MSAIIRKIYWQEYDTTTQIRSVRADIICDTLVDLPSGGILDDYQLDIGSTAKVIADGSEWQIQSSGSWVRQPSRMQLDLTGYATEQYVDTGLAAKVDTTTYTTEQAAQDAAIATKATVSDIYGLPPTTIAPGDGETDTLAAHTVPGSYVIPTATAAGRITDGPFTDKGYRMEVKQYRSGSYYRQTVYPWTEANAFYTRSRQGGATWTAWYKFTGTT